MNLYHFRHEFIVRKSINEVSAFHSDTSVLRRLTPPPMWIQIHRIDPLAEGAIAEFTMWLVFIPLGWKGLNSDVTQNGFVDEQVKGPMLSWRHQHSFEVIDAQKTKVIDEIYYQHFPGLAGIFSRILFNPLGLRALFLYRKWVTQIYLNMRN